MANSNRRKTHEVKLHEQLWLSRFDQPTIAIILVACAIVIAISFWQLQSTRRKLIDIDQAPRGTLRYVVDVNEADLNELAALPDIGPSLANAIVAHRAKHGPFQTLDKLLDVSGIGERKLEAIRPYLMPLADDSATVAQSRD